MQTKRAKFILMAMRGLLAAVFAAIISSSPVAAVSTSATLQPAVDLNRAARFQAHGLSPSPAVLVDFLEHGFPPSTNLTTFPPEPALKSQIVIDAIVECARLRTVEAAPTLARLIRGSASVGIATIVEWDVAQQRPSERLAFRERILKTLRLNAIVALGLIGDRERLYELSIVFEREEDTDLKIPAALALATLGSRIGVPYLIREVRRGNRTTSVEAAKALKLITGIDYGPDPDAPVARRRAGAKQWKSWWSKEGRLFQPRPERILARRLAPPIRPNPREPLTIRDLVDCMAYPDDRRWTLDPYLAYERLRSRGGAVFAELEKIASDKNEGLLIRRRAILLYAQMSTAGYGGYSSRQAKEAYRVIRRQRWDRNPEIREVVRDCTRRLREKRKE